MERVLLVGWFAITGVDMKVKRVLISDENPKLLESLQEILKSHGKSFDIVVANNGAEALTIVRRMPVDLVITGLRASRFDGFQLITELAQKHPQVKVIAMVGAHTPLLRSTVRMLGVDASFREPVNLLEVAECAFAELQVRTRGELWGINLTSFTQMLQVEAKTCRLKVSRSGHEGVLYFVDGELIAAVSGARSGDQAAYDILGWDNPVMEIDYLPFTQETNITQSLMTLLMDAQKKKDELTMTIDQKRKHIRFSCLVAVDYNLGQLRYRQLIRNLSLGGAYIESEAAVEVGQQLELILSSLQGDQIITLQAHVVRLNETGFGIQFDELTKEQQAFFDALRETGQVEETGEQAAVQSPAAESAKA